MRDVHRVHKISSNFELKNRVLRKNILALISHTISFNLLLILINKNTNPEPLFQTGYVKKNTNNLY